jgi:hypothetical protein
VEKNGITRRRGGRGEKKENSEKTRKSFSFCSPLFSLAVLRVLRGSA